MANDKNFIIKNGLQAGRYLQTGGTETAETTSYDLAGTSYDSKSFDFSSQFTNDGGLAFNNDGTKMYIVAFTTPNAVYQYSLSTAYDVSTASYDSVSFDVSGQATTAVAIKFNPSGTKMYIGDYGTDTTYQYSLSTAFDISTASYDSVSFSTASEDNTLRDIAFNSDGTAFYMIGTSTDTVHQYSLSTAYDISTASYDSVSFDVSTQIANPYSLVFNNDGTKMLVSGSSLIQEYTLSTGFDLSTASASSVSYTDANVGPAVRGLVYNDDGSKLYWLGLNTVHQYSTALPAQTLDLSTGSYFSFTPSDATAVSFTNAPASGKAVGFAVEVTGLDTSVGYDLASASYDSVSLSLSSYQTSPTSLFFKPDGTKVYTTGNSGDDIDEYTLSTAWDISTASHVQVFGVNSQDTYPAGVFFKPDGLKMFVLGRTNSAAYQYTLSTAWDISTASYDSVSFSLSSQGTSKAGFFFKPDGTVLFVSDYGTDLVYKYTLSTAWDLSTASYDSVSFSTASQDGVAFGLTFKPDGTKMYITGSTNDSVYEYHLSTAWDISTASYNSVNFSVASEDTVPQGIFFKDNGTKMYMIGSTGDNIYQYTTGIETSATITWPAGVKWHGGVTPTPTSTKDIYVFITIDGGTTYLGRRTAENLS